MKFIKHLFLLLVLMAGLQVAHAQHIRVGVGFGPPAIALEAPVAFPGDGYIWIPGHYDFNYDAQSYVWVTGHWELAPYAEALWTPGYWGFDGLWFWHPGHWGRFVGYYGGINYGWGYYGFGYCGGYWRGGHFWYNRGVYHGINGRGFHTYSAPVSRGSFGSHAPPHVASSHGFGGGGFHGGSGGFHGGGGHR